MATQYASEYWKAFECLQALRYALWLFICTCGTFNKVAWEHTPVAMTAAASTFTWQHLHVLLFTSSVLIAISTRFAPRNTDTHAGFHSNSNGHFSGAPSGTYIINIIRSILWHWSGLLDINNKHKYITRITRSTRIAGVCTTPCPKLNNDCPRNNECVHRWTPAGVSELQGSTTQMIY